MDDMRLIDANDLLKHLNVTSITTESKKETMQYFISGIRQCMSKLVIPTIQKAPTFGLESFWMSASCPPPTHVDEWDDGEDHYCVDISDEVWIYCIDGTRLLGKYEAQSGWYESNGAHIDSDYHGSVTHWMPLPGKPKGDAVK